MTTGLKGLLNNVGRLMYLKSLKTVEDVDPREKARLVEKEPLENTTWIR